MRFSSYITISSTKFYQLSSAIFCQSRNITPPLLVKPALRLYISILYLQGIFIFIFFQQLIIFTILVLYLFVQVLQRSQFIKVTAKEFLKLIGTANKVPYKVLGRIQVIAFPTNTVLQCSPYQLIDQYFFNFLFIIAINLDQQGKLILLFRQQVIYSFPQFIQ